MRARINHYSEWYTLPDTFDIDLDTIADRENGTVNIASVFDANAPFTVKLLKCLEGNFLDKLIFENDTHTLTMNVVYVLSKVLPGYVDIIALEFESALEDVKEIKKDESTVQESK